MNDIEQKALALVNEVRREYPNAADYTAGHIALCRAIEQHEAFRQEVSDAVEDAFGLQGGHTLHRFIIPADEPDALVEAWIEATGNTVGMKPLNAALKARGLEIREKNDDQ